MDLPRGTLPAPVLGVVSDVVGVRKTLLWMYLSMALVRDNAWEVVHTSAFISWSSGVCVCCVCVCVCVCVLCVCAGKWVG